MIGEGVELMLRTKWGNLWTVRITRMDNKGVEVALKGVEKAFWAMSYSGFMKALDRV